MKVKIKKCNYYIGILGISILSILSKYNISLAKASDSTFIASEYQDKEKYNKEKTLEFSVLSEEILLGEERQEEYPDAFPLPELTGDWRKDIIAVAESQLGYKGSDDGSTIFGAWAGDAKQAWCSEFASWCACQAGIPETVFPKKRSSRRFYNYYSEMGRFYFLEGGIRPEVSGYGNNYAGILSLKDLQPGDIILKETDGDYSNGADHTGLFVRIENGKVLYISGNSSKTVEEKICPIEKIHGICKPDYDIKKIGWQYEDNQWYYWDQKSGDKRIGWQYIDEKWYYLDEQNGNMKIGWQYINDKWYYLDMQSGACLLDTITPDGYQVDKNGAWIE